MLAHLQLKRKGIIVKDSLKHLFKNLYHHLSEQKQELYDTGDDQSKEDYIEGLMDEIKDELKLDGIDVEDMETELP